MIKDNKMNKVENVININLTTSPQIKDDERISELHKLFKDFKKIVEISKMSDNPFGALVCFGTHLNTRSQLDEVDFNEYRWFKGLGKKVDKWIREMRKYPTEKLIADQLIMEYCGDEVEKYKNEN